MSEQEQADEITKLTEKISSMKQDEETYKQFIADVQRIKDEYIATINKPMGGQLNKGKQTRKRKKRKQRNSVSRH